MSKQDPLVKEISNKIIELMNKKELNFYTFFNHSPSGMLIIDKDNNIIEINNSALNMAGLKKEEVVGKKCYEFFCDSGPEGCFLHGSDDFSKQRELVVNKGLPNEKIIIKQSIKTKINNELFVIENIMDVTELKNTKTKLKESEDKYKALIEAMNEGLGIIDPVGVITFSNMALAKMLDYTQAEIVGKNILDLVDDSNKKIILSQIEKRKKNQKSIPYEVNFLKKDGSIVSTILSPQGIYRNEKYVGSFGVITNITERKKVEKGLEEAYKIINRSPAVAFLWKNDQNWTVEFVSLNVYSLFGYPSELFLKGELRYIDLIHADDRESLIKEVEKNSQDIKTTQFKHKPYRIITKNQTVKWVEDVTYIRRNAKNEITHYEGILIDCTDRIKAEERLKEAKELAEKANSAKSQFLANISHEIRTPLNAIIGFTEVILYSTKDNFVKDRAKTIIKESELLLLLINDLLDQAKIEAGKIKLDFTDIQITELIKDIVNNYDKKAQSKNIAISTEVDDMVPRTVRVDSLRLRQVLMNLIDNAVKFTEQGGIIVRVLSENENTLKFEVKDTGIGISKDKQSIIFESFNQADVSTSRKYGGTGLGTTISRQLVKLMGGEMGLESEEGEGSTFWFTLSIAHPNSAIPVDSLEKNIQRETTTKHNVDAKILIAEDYAPNQKVVKIHLESAGYKNIEIVANGNEAVESCKNNDYDIILMDVHMPVMDGREASKKILKFKPNQLIVALTASADEKSRMKCSEAGMKAIITKPIRRESFLKDLSSHLNNSSVLKIESEENSTDETKVLQLKELMLEFGNNKAMVEKLLSNFHTQAKNQLLKIDQCMHNNLSEEIRREAHKIKGAAATLFANDFSKAARELEEVAEKGIIEEMELKIKKCRETFVKFRDYLVEKKIIQVEPEE